MRLAPFLLAAVLIAPRATAAVRLDLPVRVPGSAQQVPAPAYQGDLIELRLTPAASRVAQRARTAARTAALTSTGGRVRLSALGLPGLDRLAAGLGGVWFEPEFRGETVPPEGSEEPDFTAFYLAHLPPGGDLASALERFGGLAEVAGADPIAILPVEAIPNDSLFVHSPWYYQPPSRRDIHAPEAWDVTIGDTAIVVAVLDTGVQPDHPDLGGTVAGLPRQIWTNWIEAGGVAGVDDDGNGFVDDLHGWDFVDGAIDPIPGEDVNVEDNDPSDFAGHGTGCAGLIGAITDNGIGVSGVAWRVRIMPVRMAWASNFSPSGEVRMDFAARAIRYATRMGASVLNCSWASINSNGLDAAVGAAVRAGVTVVSAAGNNSPFHYLGDRDDVLAIAATDSNDVVTAFSNVGAFVDLTAPGENIRTTWSVQRNPGYIAGLNGTSFSAPLVSGTAALLQSFRARPLTPRGIQLRLMETADDIAAQNPGLTGLYGAGRLNTFRALVETSGSSATRTRARSIGASVLVPTNLHPQVAFLATNRTLIQLDTVTGDSVMVQNTFGAPNGHLAAADLGGSVGPALFYATLTDGVYGFAASNALLPGEWPQPGSAPFAMSGPAIGDLDGDGAVEIVSGGDDGQLWAWHGDGSIVDGYPIATGFNPLQTGAALSDLDGVAGVEVVVAAIDGTVFAFGAGGVPLPGWPVTVGANPRAPVIGRIGSEPGPVPGVTVVVAAGGQLHAFSRAGIEHSGFPVMLGGIASQDPALADLDGDGHDEIIVAMTSPSRIEVRDSLGVSLSALNWPRPLAAPPQGAPVLGELSTASPGPELVLFRGNQLMALTRDADSLGFLPKPGGAGNAPSLVDTRDGDEHTEILAGTGSDSLYYIYDAGSASASESRLPGPWPTARGNFARTGSRLYNPAPGSLDNIPPERIVDLRAGTIAPTSVQLRWSAPADIGPLGQASAYDVRRSSAPLDDFNFHLGTVVPGAPVPGLAGAPESLTVTGLAESSTWYFGIRSRDPAGRISLVSNPLQATTTGGAPGLVSDLRVAVATDSSVSLTWTATGGDGAVGRPRLYAVHGDLAPIDDASFVTAPLQWIAPATVDAGGSEYLVFPALEAATRYWFALKAEDEAGNISVLSNVVMTQTGVGGPLNGREGIALAVMQTPSRSSAELLWQASPDGPGSRQSIQLFDVTGRKLIEIVVGPGVGGRVKWDGRDAEGRSVPAGLYYARLLSGSFHTQTRLVLLP